MSVPTGVTQVLPNLWVSAMPEAHWDLAASGVDLVCSLSEHLPPQAARRYEWATRGEAQGSGRIVFLHWPFEDGDLPPRPLADLVATTVTTAVAAGMCVLVHCQEGHNRSGLIVALAYRQLFRCSGADAVVAVRACRPGALYNRAFAQALADLAPPAE